MRCIVKAEKKDTEDILKLYKSQLDKPFCAWDDNYPGEEEIMFDLSRDSLFIMKDNDGNILAAISLDQDKNVENLPCWTPELQPGAELSRLAVHLDLQNRGVAREMIHFGMDELRRRGKKSVHFLVNKFNQKAIRSYAPFHFNVMGECELYEQKFLCYEKEL
ncbi:MAG: GNAT family N-acetyltransferase [Eubacterium sp.]